MTRLFSSLLISLSLLLLAAPARAAEADLKADLAKMQGKWKGAVVGDEHKSAWRLDVKGNKATLTIKSQDGDEVLKAVCDFKLEQHGKFRAFTYSNLKHLSGGKEGQTELTEGKSRASLYKFSGSDSFSTVAGYRDDAEEDSWQIKWEKE